MESVLVAAVSESALRHLWGEGPEDLKAADNSAV